MDAAERTAPLVELTVNGRPVQVADAAGKTLLEALRDDLGLWGVKNGCGTGHCGACTVLLDGKAVLSCRTSLAKAAGRHVVTIEGLGTPEELHPLQESFVRHDAIQCGYCTPGMILTAKALLDANPTPTEQEIRHALRRNLCRCTGYIPIVRAIQAVASGRPEAYRLGPQARLAGIGQSPARKDAIAKATGRAAYAADRARPDMLHAAALHPPVPHARIRRIDVGRAQRAPGVVAVLTAQDVPGQNLFGPIQPDQPVLCNQVVRFTGDTIAVVVAESEQQARAALPLIEVDYEELPRVTTCEEALSPDAPQLHPGGNVLCHLELKRGDVDRAIAEAAAVVEDTYTTPFIAHAFLEPEACLAEPDEDGGITIWTSTQNPFTDRQQVAAALALPEEKVRLKLTAVGGAFGGREDLTVQLQAALAVRRTGRPVKMVLQRDESLLVSVKRHAARMHYVSAADAEGRLTAVRARILLDTGAYASVGSIVALRALTHACGAYALDAVDVEVQAVYTNNTLAGAMRGFGSPQAIFAAESQMDRLAEALGLDPLEMRLRNAAGVGSRLSTGQILEHSAGLRETLVRAATAADWGRRGRGVGIACCLKNVGSGHGGEHDRTGVALEVTSSGRVQIYTSAAEVGQGVNTVLPQIVAEALGARFEDVEVVPPDTSLTPDSGITSASRQTYMSGNACLLAAAEVKQMLLERGAELLHVPRDELECSDSLVVRRGDPSCCLTFAAVAETFPMGRIQKTVTYDPPATHRLGTRGPDGLYRTHAAYGYGTQIAFVQVDERTGRVTVNKIVAAVDVGRAIHPAGVIGQTVGGVVMGLGFALSEEFRVENAVPASLTLGACRIPRVGDVPEIETVIVEDPELFGPFGAKGTGELPTLPTAAAIANAIYDAVGVRITDLPCTPERILAALARKRAPAGGS